MIRRRSLHPFLKYLSSYKIDFLFALLAALTSGVLSVVYPLIMRELLDSWNTLSGSFLREIISLMFLVIAIQLIVSTLGNYIFVKATQKALVSIRYDIYQNLINKPVSFFSEQKEGHVISVFINDVNTVNGMLTGGMLNIFTSVCTFVAVVSVLFYLDWQMSFILLVLMVAFICLYLFFGPRVKTKSRVYYDELSKITNMLHEACAGIRIIKAFNYESSFGQIFNKRLMDTAKSYESLNLNGILMTELTGFISSIGLVSSILFIGLFLSPTVFSLGSAVAYFSLISSSFAPLKSIMGVGVQYKTALAAAERIQELTAIDSRCDNKEYREVPGNDPTIPVIELSQVTFSYGKNSVLSKASFKLMRGDRVLLTGKSGAGKSTLIDLLLRFRDFQTGTLKLFGINSQDLSPTWIRNHISLVQQDPFLFNDTLRGNLLLANQKASDNELIEILQTVGLSALLERLPSGLDSEVGERGAMLSGGEKQRISIARALLRDGEIVIFDEATAWLDAKTEEDIWVGLREWLEDRVIISISHNAATMFPFNKRLHLNCGRLEVVE